MDSVPSESLLDFLHTFDDSYPSLELPEDIEHPSNAISLYYSDSSALFFEESPTPHYQKDPFRHHIGIIVDDANVSEALRPVHSRIFLLMTDIICFQCFPPPSPMSTFTVSPTSSSDYSVRDPYSLMSSPSDSIVTTCSPADIFPGPSLNYQELSPPSFELPSLDMEVEAPFTYDGIRSPIPECGEGCNELPQWPTQTAPSNGVDDNSAMHDKELLPLSTHTDDKDSCPTSNETDEDRRMRQSANSSFSLSSLPAESKLPESPSPQSSMPVSVATVSITPKDTNQHQVLVIPVVASHHRAAKRRISYKELDVEDNDDGDPEYKDTHDADNHKDDDFCLKKDAKRAKPKPRKRARTKKNSDEDEPSSASKPHPCQKEGCTERFGRFYDSLRHYESAHTKKQFICERCNTALSRLDALIRHKDSVKCKKRARRAREAKLRNSLKLKVR
ncbi:hypothetical protein DFH05DRAFT_672776 [Lentinula detonsa]|uniref:C2H2-type domain-containing protein n=1 Tax=Lentinula detonsa TaxID=2804962 RepID=A0A9W8U1T2_9AGAR|nr:hypothetical protein DFH05DRAFT_672776 [Lentinula detonsa]